MLSYLILLPLLALLPLFLSLYYVVQMAKAENAKAQQRIVQQFRHYLILAAIFELIIFGIFLVLVFYNKR
ncbi:hypothetical protein D3H64_00230 [Atopobacter sp. AH10]|uniref:hypothetical protein n=1 Tax=Atopobacter sp. AH10 TaxID=2315861 RepID=UPI000EF18579|nr:hypothetical protein [Atopobacter sp. AH10]RLK64240.1 hypothetical protein D3H64_00230 [Atopobacter sp. AH10]